MFYYLHMYIDVERNCLIMKPIYVLLQIFVVGPAGCGKSECIKTFGFSERERGKTIAVQTLFTKAVESEELMGYFHTKNG